MTNFEQLKQKWASSTRTEKEEVYEMKEILKHIIDDTIHTTNISQIAIDRTMIQVKGMEKEQLKFLLKTLDKVMSND